MKDFYKGKLMPVIEIPKEDKGEVFDEGASMRDPYVVGISTRGFCLGFLMFCWSFMAFVILCIPRGHHMIVRLISAPQWEPKYSCKTG